MQDELRKTLLERVRRRVGQGDFPTEPSLSVENLEDLVIALASRATTERDLTGIAESIAEIVIAWVDARTMHGLGWRRGLAEMIRLRLERFITDAALTKAGQP